MDKRGEGDNGNAGEREGENTKGERKGKIAGREGRKRRGC
jgi:hypothetical protein